MRHRSFDQKAYSTTEITRLFGISKKAAQHAAANKDLPAIRVGKLFLFPKVEIDKLLGLTENTEA